MVNLDDTRRCPVGPECESCGRLEELAVLTGDTPAGIVCMTLCDDCEVAGVDPISTPAEETARVLAHGQHVPVQPLEARVGVERLLEVDLLGHTNPDSPCEPLPFTP